ncbi:hypothetical protein [Pseudarthrobacter sp. N5]|uniref:hypothetical protein n=1 Tax=Pseudarthrobacter sp. N5 TaxID=3418416 RepID=UPI003CE6ED39
MGKKTNRPKNKGSRHLSAVPSAPRMPLQLVLNHRVVDSLTGDFVRWYEGSFGDASDALDCLEVVKLFITTTHALTDRSSATTLELAGLEDAAETIAGTLIENDGEDALDDLYDTLHVYVDYLKESGHWSGTDAEYVDIHAFLTDESISDFQRIPDFQVPELSDQEQDQAFAGLPLMQKATSLLEWIGAGKEVTSTGVLRLKDVATAAAAVGIHAVGKRAAKGPMGVAFRDAGEEGGHQESPLEVGTMHDVPVLSDVWAALVRSGIITIGSTRATPGPEAGLWSRQDVADRLGIRREFTTAFLADAVTDTDSGWSGQLPELDGVLAVILAKGATAEPMEVEELTELATNGDTGDIFLAFSALRARSKLAALADFGLVRVDSHYTVAPVVVQSLAPAIAEVLLSEEGYDPEEFEDFLIAAEGEDVSDDDGMGTAGSGSPRVNAPPSNVIQLHPDK